MAVEKSTRSAAAGEPAATSKAIQDLGHSSVAATDPYSAHRLKEDRLCVAQSCSLGSVKADNDLGNEMIKDV